MASQKLRQGGVIHNAPAAGVDECDIGLHALNQRGVDERMIALAPIDVDGEDVAAREQFFN